MQTNAEAVGLSAAGLQTARDYVADCVERGEISGAMMLAARNGQIAQMECLGLRDVEAGLPMQPDTIFRIASMTKPVVSVAIMQLIDAGKLRLDDPVSRYIPEFADTKVFAGIENGQVKLAALERPITIYHLLTHTSGVAYDAPDPALVDYDFNSHELTQVEVMRRLATRPLAHQPGSNWSYGFSHDVLARIIEVITGTTLGDALKTAIFAPLDMADTGFYAPPEKIGRLAAVYEKTDAGLTRYAPDWLNRYLSQPVYESGGGGLVSTVSDYYRFASMLLNRGELDGIRLLQPGTVDVMRANHLTGTNYPIRFGDFFSQGEGYGLGVSVAVEPALMSEAASLGTYAWGGSLNTVFWIDPVKALIGIFMIQSQPFDYGKIGAEFRARVYQALTD